MKRWEYTTIYASRTMDVLLGQLGAEGWELVCAIDTGYGPALYLKRELLSEESAGYMIPPKSRGKP